MLWVTLRHPGWVSPTTTLSVVTDLVTRTAAVAREATEQVDAVVEILGGRTGAGVGLQVRADVEHLDVSLVGSAASLPHAAGLRHQLRSHQLHEPLLERIRAGDLSPTTAERTDGREEWAHSDIRRQCRLAWHIDHIATLPVCGGDHFVTYLLGRQGRDFDDIDLSLLATVQPVVAGLARLTEGGEGLQPLDVEPPPLTRREAQVMDLLAQGHKATTIARLVGCSHRTIHRHLGNIYAKLDVGDRLSAVNRAHELGMIHPGASLSAASG